MIEKSILEETTPCLPKSKEASIFRMIFLGTVVVLPGLLDGISMTFAGIALPQMNLDINDASTFGSLNAVGVIISAVLGGFIVDKFGRKPTAMMAIVPTTIGWFLIGVGYTKVQIFTGRILTGVANGVVYLGQVYSTECIFVNHPHLQDHVNTWYQLLFTFGEVFCYVLSASLPYQQVALVTASIGVFISLSIFWFIPESPKWLYQIGRLREARHSEKQLSIYQPLYARTYYTDTYQMNIKRQNNIWGDFQRFREKNVYKPMFILTSWFSLIAFNGGAVLTTYMVYMLTDNNDQEQNFDAYQLSIISGICGLVATILMSCIITCLGIKLLFISSSFFMSLSLAAYAISEFPIKNWQKILKIIHVISVWIMMFFYSLGTIKLAFSVIGDMCPHNFKGLACIPTIVFNLMKAVAVKLHLYLYEYYENNVYFGYAIINLISILFTAIFIPETMRKT